MEADQIIRSHEGQVDALPPVIEPSTPDPAALAAELHRNRTRAATAARVELERQLAAAKRDQVDAMIRQHEAGDSWVLIGRLAGMTATAAMYATGHAVRTPRRQQKDTHD